MRHQWAAVLAAVSLLAAASYPPGFQPGDTIVPTTPPAKAHPDKFHPGDTIVPTTPPATAQSRDIPFAVFSDCTVDLQKGGGVYNPEYWASITLSSAARAPVSKRITIKVMVDTGFSGVLSLPRPLVNYLRANNLINDRYNIGEKITSQLADGSVVENNILYTVGEVAFTGCDVVATLVPIIITNDGATPLIGQEILSSYKSATIDHQNLQLILKAYPLPPCVATTCRGIDPNAKPFPGWAPGSKPFFLGETPR
jgi:hypothetical protein